MNTSIRSSLAVAGCLSVLLVQASNCYASSNITLRDNVFSNLINKGVMTGAATTIGAGVSAKVEDNSDAYPKNPLRIVDENSKDLGAAKGDITNHGTLSNDEEITIKLTNDSVVDGGGTLTLTNNSSNSGTIEQMDITVNKGFNNDGTITVEDFKNKETGDITGSGTINITSTGANNGKFSGQNIIVGDSATFENKGSISGGSITVNGGEYTQNGTMDGNLNLIINEGAVKVSKNKGIDVNGQIKIETDGTVELGNNSTITLHNSDTWDGTIENSNNGTVTIIGAAIENATYKNDEGNGQLVIQGGTFNWTENSSLSEKGSITVENGGTLRVLGGASFDKGGEILAGEGGSTVEVYDTIGDEVKINITSGTTYKVLESLDEDGEVSSTGELTLGTNVDWDGGKLVIAGGKVTYAAIEPDDDINNVAGHSGILQAEKGSLSIERDLNLVTAAGAADDNKSYIKDAIAVFLDSDVNLNIVNSDVELGGNDDWSGNVILGNTDSENPAGGSLTINGVKENGVLQANNGTLKITGNDEEYKLVPDPEDPEAEPEEVLVREESRSEVTIGEGSYIAQAVKTAIDNESTVTISDENSYVYLDKATGDSWDNTSTINLEDGTLNYSLDSNGVLSATGGNLNIEGGKLTLTTYTNGLAEDDENYKEYGTSKIDESVNLALKNDAELVIDDLDDNGIEVTFGEGDSWAEGAKVSMTKGTLNYDLSQNGKVNITGGVFKIGESEAAELTLKDANDIIAKEVELTINDDSKLNIENGKVTIDGGDSELSADDWSGAINLSGNGDLTIDGVKEHGALQATGGKLSIINGSEIDITGTNVIAEAVKTTLENSTLNISNSGSVTLDRATGDSWDANSTINLDTNGTLNYDLTSNGKLVAEGGNLNIKDGGVLTLTDSNDKILTAVNTVISEKATLDVQNGNVTIDGTDTWAGTLGVSGEGNLTIDGVTSNGALQATGGKLSVKNSTLNIGSDSQIGADATTTLTDTIINITGGNVALNTGDSWSEDSTINLTTGTLDYALEENGTLVATGGNLNVSGGKLTLAANSSVAEAVATTVKGDVDITGGSLVLNGSDTWASDKTVKMTDGTFDYSLTQNGKVDITGGEFNIKDVAVLTMNDSNDKLGQGEDDVAINLAGTLNVKEGNAIINANDTWTGKVTVTDNGNLNIDSVTSHGILQATGGTMNVNKSTLDISGDNVIAGANKTTLTESIVNISNGGSVTLDDIATDSWAESTQINLNEGGKLDYNLNANGDLAASAGELTTHKGSNLEITSENSYIQSAVAAKLEGDLLIGEKGVVTVGDDRSSSSYIQDVMTGNVTIDNGGTLNIYNSVKLATGEEAKNQYITLNDTGLMNLEISTGEALHFETGLKGDGDIHKNGDGDVWFHGDYENYTGTILINNSGDLYFEHDLMGGLELGDIDGETIGINADKITGDLVQEREATIKYSTYHDDVDLNLNGDIKVTKGTIIAESKGDTNINFGGEINVIPAEDAQNPVEMNVTSKGNVTFDKNVSISDSTLNLTAGKGASFNQNTILNDSIMNVAVGDLAFNNLVFEGTNSTLNDMNGAINNNAIKNLDITKNGLADFKIDVNGRKWQSDKFIISDITEIDGGQINVSDWQLLGKAPIDRHIKLNVFDVSQVDPAIAANINFTQTDKEIFTPIGWYKLENATQRNPLTGMRETILGTLNASLARYNPQVFRGQVATMAMYNNQLVIDDMLTNHVPLQSERFLAQGEHANKYAAVNPLFAPYQYRKEDGGIWVKNYVTFEHLSMTHNLKVGNNAYGTLIGADFPIVNMKNGWKFLPTAYIGYNGGHQHFDGVSMYQNGGQGGFMGTFMKKDFIGSVVAYAGGYFNEMKVAGYSDETGNWFAGTAAKASYNLHATKHFSVQPNLFVSYNAFGKQNWSTDFGDMSMASGMINGVNVAPGLNLIYARETWSLYGTFQYMYNINEGVSGNAGHVDLPDVKMKHGYIQYGLGVTKTWKDRLNSFFQLTFRNGGRTGIGFQLGFQYLFDWFKGGHKKTSSVAPKNKTLIKKL